MKKSSKFKFWRKAIFILVVNTIFIKSVYAHCPLCVAGAAVATGGALWLGVNKIVIALFLGAFAVAMGWWIARLIKKQYVRYQKSLLVLLSFLLTIPPVLPLLNHQYPLYITLFGDYGSLLNRVYLLDLSLLTSILGGLVILASPKLSEALTKFRSGRMIPFQGMIITFLLLLVGGLILQFVV